MKKMDLIQNRACGVDLMVERDAGNMVRVLTGNAGNSLKFWEDLRKLSDEAIDLIETELGGDEDVDTSMASSKVEWR
jgi:hypothetical protein